MIKGSLETGERGGSNVTEVVIEGIDGSVRVHTSTRTRDGKSSSIHRRRNRPAHDERTGERATDSTAQPARE